MTREEAIKIIESNCSSSGSKLRDACAMFIPELAESKDEKIRKTLLRCCDDWEKGQFGCMAKEDVPAIRAYLERQREQKPAEKQDYSGLNDLERAIHRGFLSAGVENVPVTIIKETAQECLLQMKLAEWSEEDEKMLTNMNRYIEVEKLKAEIERRNLSNRYITTEGYEQELYEIIASLQQEQPEVDLEKAARNVYESMDDVRRDMVELGRVINARKEK